MLASDFSWFSLLPFLEGHGMDLVPVCHSLLAVVIILGLALVARMSLMRKVQEGRFTRAALVPDDDLKPRNLFELLTEMIYGLCRNELGDKAARYFPLVGAIFIYILVCNLLGLIPGFIPATSHLETNIGMAVVVFAVYNIAGFAKHGFGYLKHFLGPVLWLAPLMVIVEVLNNVARPVTLSLRLFGNMFGDHTVLSIFMYELPEQTIGALAYGIPVIFLGLGTFVCVVQAFVFALLTIVYISLATAEEEH